MAKAKKQPEPIQEEKNIADLENELAATIEINKQLVKEIEQGPAKAEITEKPVTSKRTFTHNGVEYGFRLPGVNLAGTVITADEVLADEDLQAKLVSISSGMIYPV